jgi:hypothetical protein
MKTIEILKFNPCIKSIEFRNQYPDFQSAWNACPRGDWMLWIASKLNIDEKVLILAKGLCANTVRHLMKNENSLKAIDTAIAFGNGFIPKEELQLSYAAAAAAYAADAATYSAAYSAAADAEKENQLKTANICREILTEHVFNALDF